MQMNIKMNYHQGLRDDIKHIPEKVFVEEKGVQNEFNEYDEQACHLVIYYNQKAVDNNEYFKKILTVMNTQLDELLF